MYEMLLRYIKEYIFKSLLLSHFCAVLFTTFFPVILRLGDLMEDFCKDQPGCILNQNGFTINYISFTLKIPDGVLARLQGDGQGEDVPLDEAAQVESEDCPGVGLLLLLPLAIPDLLPILPPQGRGQPREGGAGAEPHLSGPLVSGAEGGLSPAQDDRVVWIQV